MGGVGYIPFTAITSWANFYSLDKVAAEFFVSVIFALDAIYVKHINEKDKHDGTPPNNDEEELEDAETS